MTASDFLEPIIGFRAWEVVGHELAPWSARTAGPWSPGINQARCLRHPDRPGHVPPVAACSCGLYALARSDDDRLCPRGEAVGAIVGWGDVEVHRSGFRAQYAAVVALGLPDNCPPRHLGRLRVAAQHYRVPLVPLECLLVVALEYGRPIAFDALLGPSTGRGSQVGPPLLDAVGRRGIALDEHLVVTIEGDGVRLSPTGPLRSELLDSTRGPLPPAGQALRRGDVIVHAGGHTGLVIRSALSGYVTATAAGSSPGDWSVLLRPSEWHDEAPHVDWRGAAPRVYAAIVADLAARGDAFGDLRTSRISAYADVRSAGDVLAALRAARGMPRFRSEDDVYAQVGKRLGASLAEASVAKAAARAPMRIAWRLHRPDADLLIDTTGGRPRVVAGASDDRADIVLFSSAETADDYFAGRVDLSAALRRREIQTPSEVVAVLRAASVLKAVHSRYAARVAQAARPR